VFDRIHVFIHENFILGRYTLFLGLTFYCPDFHVIDYLHCNKNIQPINL